jgi:hypothetical protein
MSRRHLLRKSTVATFGVLGLPRVLFSVSFNAMLQLAASAAAYGRPLLKY